MLFMRKIIKNLLLAFALAIVLTNFCVGSSELNICGVSSLNDSSSNLIYVSTLDGKLSAIDISKNGRTKWTIDFKEGSLVSSNISQKEFNNNGQQIKMIPSLSGRLYKLINGKELELVPITTDQLLGPYSYSDELKFSGGKEKFFYTISSKTGKILYKSDITGTNNINGDELLEQDILIVERYQHTVRAVEAPHEQWNYSVAQYKLELKPKENLDCQQLNYLKELEVTANIADGIVWVINSSDPTIKQKYKFDSPIVSIWRMIPDDETEKNDNKLVEIDLFNQHSEFSNNHTTYIGVYNNQIYVQENTNFNKLIELSSIEDIIGWKFYPSSNSNDPIIQENNNKAIVDSSSSNSISSSTLNSDTTLSILFDNDIINGGFFLYTKCNGHLLNSLSQIDMKINNNNINNNNNNNNMRDCIKPHVDLLTDDNNNNNNNNLLIENLNNNNKDNIADNDTPVQVMIVSLWYWWKEVFIISVTTAVLLNFMLNQRVFNPTPPTKDAILPPLIVERHIEIKKESKSPIENLTEFKSRYLSDFEPIDCLGKGGYGVVFEAKNKIDECNYAIKRIALSKSQNSRDRVMREVRALAKLDHHNIVRYFHAWLECPPSGWQEAHDEIYINKQKLSPSLFTSENSNMSINSKQNGSICIDVPPSERSSVDSALEAVELNLSKDNNSSFIVFSSSSSDEFNSTKDLCKQTFNENHIDHYDDNENSESIVFKNDSSSSSSSSSNSNSNSNISSNNNNNNNNIIDINSDSSEKNKLLKRMRKESLSLDCNKKVIKKSPKMFLYIQMQLCQKLSLREWLRHQSNQRDYSRIVDIFQQIVDAVEYVHLQGLIHRDLKPSNIFFAYDDKIKIGDFGLVTAMIKCCEDLPRTPGCTDDGMNTKNCFHTACVGTHLYMSPEQRNGKIYNYKVDIYSLGIIFFELLIPFSTEMERVNALTNVKKFIFPNNFVEKYPQEFEVLKMMLDENPKNRPTTLGIKARLPLVKLRDEKNFDNDHKWHFELPQLSRHSSVTASSSGESWENISSV